MKKPIYYYTGVSGRVRFVVFNGEYGNELSNERMPIKKWQETIQFGQIIAHGVRKFKHLKNKEVELNGHKGKIVGCNPNPEFLKGKYIGEGKYLSHPELLQFNHLVQVYWYSGFNPCWVPFFKCKLV